VLALGGVGTKYDHSFVTKKDACSGWSTHRRTASRQPNAPERWCGVPAHSVFVLVSCRPGSKRKFLKPSPSTQSTRQPVSALASSRTSVSV
jgi:hypothetical protein